jgi:hypothetical protein
LCQKQSTGENTGIGSPSFSFERYCPELYIAKTFHHAAQQAIALNVAIGRISDDKL